MKFKEIFTPIDAQFAVSEEDDKTYLEGYAIRFGLRTQSPRPDKSGKFVYYVVGDSAFDELLEDETLDVALLHNHDDAQIMARTVSGTLQLFKDEIGIRMKAEIDLGISYANDAYLAAKRGDLHGMSFRAVFLEKDLTPSTDEEGFDIKTIDKVAKFIEVSTVSFPAFSGTNVIAASEEEVIEEPKKEDVQKEEAKTYSSQIYRKRTHLLKLKK